MYCLFGNKIRWFKVYVSVLKVYEIRFILFKVIRICVLFNRLLKIFNL